MSKVRRLVATNRRRTQKVDHRGKLGCAVARYPVVTPDGGPAPAILLQPPRWTGSQRGTLAQFAPTPWRSRLALPGQFRWVMRGPVYNPNPARRESSHG